MIINSIKLFNFRQYKGLNKVDFSIDKDKNVTVILGLNTSGKTTLIQAFNWCLYGKCIFPEKELLNIEILNKLGNFGHSNLYVEMELIHEGRLYVIRRSQDINLANNKYLQQLKVSYKEDDGQMQEMSPTYAQDTVDKILPPGLSDYFFFDGEHINDINNKKDVVASIKGLMGIDIIGEAVKHLNPNYASSVYSKFKNELDIVESDKNNKLKERLEYLKNKLAEKSQELEMAKMDQVYFKDRKQELENKIRDNKDTKDKQEAKTRLEYDLQRLENGVPDLVNKLIRDFSKNGFKYFAQPLYDDAIKIIEDAKDAGVGIPDMHYKAIEYILNRGKCICGRDLSNDEEAIKSIKYEGSLLPPGNIGTTIATYKSTCNQYVSDVEYYYDNVVGDYKNIRQNANRISEIKDRIAQLSLELQGNLDVGAIERDNQDNERQLNDVNAKIEKYLVDIGGINQMIADVEKEIDGLVITNEKNLRIQKNIAYSLELYNWFKASYDKKEKDIKEELHASINKYFNEMYHGKRVVEINPDYKIILKSQLEDGTRITDTSPGLDTVKNFAFIAGLVEIAKKHANEKQEEEIEMKKNEPYPIVMDAPFSNADETHIENISKILPQVAEQVILIVMNKDWDYAKKTMGDKVDALYTIEKASETSSSIRRI